MKKLAGVECGGNMFDPGNLRPINEIYAWMSVDGDGNMGIVAADIGPLVFGDPKIAEAYRPSIEKMVREMKGKYDAKLFKFSNRELVDQYLGVKS